MKYLYIFIFINLIGLNYLSSQNLGGQLTFKKLPFPLSTYEITLTRYTKFPSTINLDKVLISTGDFDSSPVMRTDSVLLSNQILKSRYVLTHTYGNFSGQYLISFKDSIIENNIINFPNPSIYQYPFYLESYLWDYTMLGDQNSVTMLNDPILHVKKDTVFRYNVSAVDLFDVDSISYSLIDLDNSGGAYWIPNTITINPISGEIIWDKPTIAGSYFFVALIEEYRYGILVGFIRKAFSIIVDSAITCSNQFLGTGTWSINLNGYYETHITPETDFSLSFIYSDSKADSINLSAFSETFEISNQASFTKISLPGQKIGFYHWIPDINQVRNFPYVVVFRGSSFNNTLYVEQDLTLMIYVDTQTSIVELVANDIDISTFPNPTTTTLTIDFTNNEPTLAIGETGTISLYSIDGSLVYNQQVKNQKTTSMDISKLAAGVYVLRVVGDGFVGVRKVVKE